VFSTVDGSSTHAKWHITDSQIQQQEAEKVYIGKLKGARVIAKIENEKIGEGDFYVDILFMCHGNP